MNTDQFQRGMIQFNGFGAKSDQFANPNQYLSKKTEINDSLRRIISKVKAVPLNVLYDIEIQLATANEVDKCSQKLLDTFYNYMFFNFDYFGLKIDAVLVLPDDKAIEIPRENSLDKDRKKTIKFALNISTYYPIFKITSDDLEICDNDDEIDWENLNVPRPTTNFQDSLKNYNASYGQMGFRGGTITGVTFDDGTTGSTTGMYTPEGIGEIKRAYWGYYVKNYLNLTQKKEKDYPNSLEDFDTYPVDSGEPPIN